MIIIETSITHEKMNQLQLLYLLFLLPITTSIGYIETIDAKTCSTLNHQLLWLFAHVLDK